MAISSHKNVQKKPKQNKIHYKFIFIFIINTNPHHIALSVCEKFIFIFLLLNI